MHTAFFLSQDCRGADFGDARGRVGMVGPLPDSLSPGS